MADFTGTAADDVFNAPATSATTGAAATTVNSGDTINGGLGNDTLNITATAANNNSLTGLTATSIETVNITGANNLGASSPAFAAAQDAKAVTAAALASAQASLVVAAGRENAATALVAQAGAGTNGTIITATKGGLTEAIVVGSSTATVSAAAQLKAAADYIDNVTIGALDDTAAKTALDAIVAAGTTAVPTGVTAFTVAQYKAAAAAALTAADGAALAVGTTNAMADRAAVLAEAATAVDLAAKSTTVDLATAVQQKAAADAVDAIVAATTVAAVAAGTDASVTTFTATAYTVAQYRAAAAAALLTENGVPLVATVTADATAILARAATLAIAAGALVTFEQAHGDFTIGQLNAVATEALSSLTGSTLRTNLDDGVAIFNRASAKATEAGAVLTSATTSATTAAAADASAANAVTVALAGVGATSVSAATFADATAITLSGDSSKANVTAVAATQTIGFSGVTSMENVVSFGATVTNGLLSTTGSSGALTVTGSGLTSLSLAGTTAGGATTTLALTEGTTAATVDTIKALNVSTTGATVLNTVGLSALTSVSQSGAGAVTLNATGTAATLATITTGAGADSVRVTTAVAADVASTTVNETVTAVVSTGGGNDRVVVATGGAATNGITTVDLGDGNDTLILTSINTGLNSLSGGAGDDVFRIGAISTLASTSINGGSGTDVLRTSTGSFATADYATLTANVSSVETLQLEADATLDASRVTMGRIEFLSEGANVVTEVSSLQQLAMIRSAVISSTAGTVFNPAAAQLVPDTITASSKGYVFAAGLVPTVFGENINLTMTQVAAGSTAVVNASALTLSVSALGQTVGATSTSDVAAIASSVLLTGSDVQTINATLTSARGSGTRTDLSSTGLGTESMAALNLGTVTADNTAVAGQQGNLQNLSSVTVSGAGVVTINAGAIAAVDAKLATINLSGMTAFADLNSLGQEVNGTTVGGYTNRSTSTVTLNDFASETVILGGAKDTVVTGSTIVKVDTVTGFQVVASAADPLVADATRSDVLDLGAAGGVAFIGGVGGNAAKMTVTGSSLEAALLQASALKAADGTTNVQNVVFAFGGNTYAYSDQGAEGLTDGDFLVKMSGSLNLDLLLTSGVIIA